MTHSRQVEQKIADDDGQEEGADVGRLEDDAVEYQQCIEYIVQKHHEKSSWSTWPAHVEAERIPAIKGLNDGKVNMLLGKVRCSSC